MVTIFFSDGHLSKDTIEQNLSIHRQIGEFAKENGLDTVYDGGDDFESRKAQPLDILDGYAQQLEIFNELSVTKRAFPGNHDKPDYESEKSYLDIFRHFPGLDLIREHKVCLHKDFQGKNIYIHCIPYFKEDTVYVDYLEKAIEFVDECPNSKHILFTHIAVDGVINNDGSEVSNPLKSAMFTKFDKVFVGHYHNRSQVGDNIFYIGSTAPKNYGETNEKGFCILYEDLSHEYVNLDFKPYHVIRVDINEHNTESLTKLSSQYADMDGFVRFEFFGDEEKLKALDQNLFKSQGIDVKIKNPEIEVGIEQAEKGEFVNYDPSSLLKEFEEIFCAENGIEDVDMGINYLNKIIEQNGQR